MDIKRFNDRGQVMVLIALAAIGLIAMVGLAIDGSAKFSDQRHAQNAADTAALAGALDLVGDPLGPNGDWKLAAQDRAISNGYQLLTDHSTVEVYLCDEADASCGPYTGHSDYVQVIITSIIDTTFSRVIGIRQLTTRVQAVALAKTGGDLGDGAMLISYDPSPGCSNGVGSGGGSVDVGGGATVNLHGGGIFLNSQSTCGYYSPSCAATLNIYNGSVNSAGSGNVDTGCLYGTTVKYNQEPVLIPDDVYIPPEPPQCKTPANAYQTGPNEFHITPGYYTSFPQQSINGNDDPTDILGKKKDIIMDPGVYCVGGNIKWSGATFDSLTGTGVTIYLKRGYTFSLTIDSPIKLYAPKNTGSDYDGYLIIQDGTPANIKDCNITASTKIYLEGTVFSPYCNITVNGGSDPYAEINAQLVGWNLKVNGNTIINFYYDPELVVKVKNKVGLMR